MFSDPDSGETTAPAVGIEADDFRFGPLVPGVSYTYSPQTRMFSGCARTAAWNTPDGITLEQALRHTGLDPAFWNVVHITAHMWDDPAQAGSVIAYEFQLAETGTGLLATA